MLLFIYCCSKTCQVPQNPCLSRKARKKRAPVLCAESSHATRHSLRYHFAFLLPLSTFASPYPVNSVNPVQSKKPPVTASHAVVAQREGGSPLNSRRWSLDLLLRSLLKCQQLMPDPSATLRGLFPATEFCLATFSSESIFLQPAIGFIWDAHFH